MLVGANSFGSQLRERERERERKPKFVLLRWIIRNRSCLVLCGPLDLYLGMNCSIPFHSSIPFD
jgi:hypothetical protein